MTMNQDNHTPTMMPTDNRPRNMGKSLDDNTSRLDAIAKVTGKAKYGKDHYFANGLYARLVRCPYGAATLTSYEEENASNVPGVVEVTIDGDKGRYHGHSVGYVVAETELALRRGMRALDCKWKKSGAIKTSIADTIDDVPAVTADNQALLNKADHVLNASYSTSIQTHSSAETHGVSIEHKGDHAVIHASTQGTFATRDGLERSIGLPRSAFEVNCEYVGGGFGSKLGFGKESHIAAQISDRYKRPVHLFVDRAEEHLDTGNRPGSTTHVSVGFNNDGTLVGGQIRTFGLTGVANRGGGVSVPSRRYTLGKIDKQHRDVQTNGGAPRAFRAPGSPQGAFVEELMLDEIATRANIDPLALRLKLETNGDRKEMFALGAETIGWTDRHATGKQTGTIRRGFGLGSASWGRFPARAEADIVINQDGSVECITGSQDIGTGQRTVMAVVAAHVIGVPLQQVAVRIGNSRYPASPGSGGSMTVHNTEPAMREAAEQVRAKLLDHVAASVGGDASEFDIVDGVIRRNGSSIASFNEACGAIAANGLTGHGSWDQREMRNDPTTGHSHGVQFADLHVDTETGIIRVNRIVAIQSCGKVICRKTAESQILGGVIQGLSYALFENKIHDPQLGAMLNPNLESYKIAGTADIPHIEPILWTKNQTGTRSLGEPPTIPTSGAIACAVFNAIGVPVRQLPLTPDLVLKALEGGAG